VGKYGLSASGSVADCCEHRNEPLGSMKGGGFLYQLTDYWFLKKNSAP